MIPHVNTQKRVSFSYANTVYVELEVNQPLIAELINNPESFNRDQTLDSVNRRESLLNAVAGTDQRILSNALLASEDNVLSPTKISLATIEQNFNRLAAALNKAGLEGELREQLQNARHQAEAIFECMQVVGKTDSASPPPAKS